MPEPPDFEQLAQDLAETIRGERTDRDMERRLAEQLRQVWNARGAADIAKLEWVFDPEVPSYGPPSMKTLDRALRSLDR